MYRFHFVKILLIILLAFLQAMAGNTGKIAGRILDGETGEPLIGANVLVKDSPFGASTDVDGFYSILNLPPGNYTIQAMYIGYNTTEITDVRVSVDLTSKIDVKLSPKTLEIAETITVVAKRQAVQKDVTATTAVISSEEIAALPVTEISEVLSLQAGYVDGHMRGGRSGEIAYWIDGVPVTDAYDGGTVVEVNKDMVEELQFISGAFNAEYGQAMSGIVNITTKEPSKRFGGSFKVYTGDYVSFNKVYENEKGDSPLNGFNPTHIYNVDGGIYGQIIPEKLSYFLNGRYIYFGGWYYGEKKYNPQNVSVRLDNDNFILSRDPKDGLGNGKFVPMNWNRKMYGQGKLIYNITPLIKLSYSYILDNVKYQDYDRSYKYNPDGNLNRFRIGNSHLLKMTHMLSDKSFYEIGASYFSKSYRQYVYEDVHDPRYIHPSVSANLPDKNFNTGGTNNQHFKRETITALLKADFTTQFTKAHLIKAGVEVRQHDIFFEDIKLQPATGGFDPAVDSPYMQTVVFPKGTIYHAEYRHKPQEFSAYLQDKMEFEDLIVNLGMRFDYFDADGSVLSDPTDPDILKPRNPQNIYHDENGDGIRNSEDLNFNGILDAGEDTNNNGMLDYFEPLVTLKERQAYWYKKVHPKVKISPRLGVSFPVTSKGVVHFSYGHFFQIPNFEYLYRNPHYQFEADAGNLGIIGNADLRPQQTISGEVGYKQELDNGIVVDVTGYFRDIRDLVGTRADVIALAGGDTYNKLVNSDFGYVKGVILSLRSPYGQRLNYTIDYTYQVADGTASDPNSAREAVAAGNQPEVLLVPLSWDQRHTLNATASYILPTWGVSFIGNLGSGLPYTPRKGSDVSDLRENSSIKPATWNVDMRFYKDFTISNLQLTFFLRVFNLFDHLNENSVYNDTGRAGFTTDLERDISNNAPTPVNSLEYWYKNMTHYSEPRRIETGVTFKF